MTATTIGKSGRRAIIAAGYATMENINRENEGLLVAGPCATRARPSGTSYGAVVNTPTETTAVVTFPEAELSYVVPLSRTWRS
jgi:hypothetical protein